MGAKGQRRQKTAARTLLAAERRVKAIELRHEGKTFGEIGAALGVSPQAAHKIITSTLDALNARLVTETAKLRQDQLDEIHTLKAALWRAAKAGNLGAIDRIERLMARAAKLAGLDAAEKHEHGGPGGSPLTPLIMLPPESDD